MTELYPPIEPYDQGLLDAGDGNLVYWGDMREPPETADKSASWRRGWLAGGGGRRDR